MGAVAKMVTEAKVKFIAPFVDWDKPAILLRGLMLDVPFELTRTCYKDQPKSCGKCGACHKRLEAFASHGKKDPIKYEKGIDQ
jgi:7-cyano-7-deazaguanine synthase